MWAIHSFDACYYGHPSAELLQILDSLCDDELLDCNNLLSTITELEEYMVRCILKLLRSWQLIGGVYGEMYPQVVKKLVQLLGGQREEAVDPGWIVETMMLKGNIGRCNSKKHKKNGMTADGASSSIRCFGRVFL
ncbi:hypothetical protein ACP70R_023491 [Stipagrostis hirtigluma subsp. patula]